MSFNKALRWSLAGVLALLTLVVALLVLFSFVPIKVDLGSQRGLVEAAASGYLDRPVRIEGEFNLSTSLWPAVEIVDIHIGNPGGFSGKDLLVMKQAKLSLSLLSLLQGKLHIRGVSVDGLDVQLIKNSEGAGNWVFNPPENGAAKPEREEKALPDSGTLKLTSDSLVIQSLEISNVLVSYQEPGSEQPVSFRLDRGSGTALPGEPLTLTMQGSLLKHSFSGDLNLGSLQELIEENRSWVALSLEIAGTRFDIEGGIDILPGSDFLQLKVGMAGESLSSLNQLVDLDLPPIKAYKTDAVLSSRKKGQIDLSKVLIQVGESSLRGSMKVNITSQPAVASIELSSPLIQLDDFDVGEWSPEPVDKGSSGNQATTPEKTPATAGDGQLQAIMSPEVLKAVNVSLEVAVEKVLSGKDELGSGLLVGTLNEGRFKLDPVTLRLPGGSFELALSLKPGDTASDAEVRVKSENFDFGVLARQVDPDTDIGGTINLDVNLKTVAKNVSGLLKHANGHFDFSGHPVNLRSGVIDLWAVNLIASIVEQGAKDESRINCLVSRLKMEDGVLTPETFVIDTSRIRICGSGQADFKQGNFKFSVVPTPKEPQFFSLATPFQVSGKFTDFDMGIKPGGIIGTTVSWITSPLHVPVRKLVGTKLPADGGDVCNVILGASSRPVEPVPGCR
ncbi:MAG: AsmA family protein [Desulfuromonadaceae bacterium]|nr:AsmA family protein [Desulfuromonadaceae bacterium]